MIFLRLKEVGNSTKYKKISYSAQNCSEFKSFIWQKNKILNIWRPCTVHKNLKWNLNGEKVQPKQNGFSQKNFQLGETLYALCCTLCIVLSFSSIFFRALVLAFHFSPVSFGPFLLSYSASLTLPCSNFHFLSKVKSFR